MVDLIDDGCCDFVEPCHIDECDGFDEVMRLLPSGRMFQRNDDSLIARFNRALGHINTDISRCICQEWNEANPCTSKRLLPYWAQVYSLPECVEQTGERLCEWIDLLQGDCPPGSFGFLQLAIDFVAPGKGITIERVDAPDLGTMPWRGDCHPALIVTAPPECFFYDEMSDFELDDRRDACGRYYFIPEIECLKCCIFPMGYGVAYQTETNTVEEPVMGVPEENIAPMPATCIVRCEQTCEDCK